MKTLAIDIGGSGIKLMVLDAQGAPLNERFRVPTPRPATPLAVVQAIGGALASMPPFDRISVGFPGVVIDGVVFTGANFDGDWHGFPLGPELEALTKRVVRVANDADVQGLGVVEGKGVEMVITLGTGMGSALFLDGRLVPNLELGHHPLRRGKTYEQSICDEELVRIGKKKWNKRMRRVIAQLEPIFNYRLLYIGGGNARKLEGDLPENVRIVENVAGILGGIKLWRA